MKVYKLSTEEKTMWTWWNMKKIYISIVKGVEGVDGNL